MQEFCAAALPVRHDGMAWQVGLLGGAWQTVRTGDGKLPVEMPPGWFPTVCLDFWGDGHLLLLTNPDGGRTTWVLDEAFRTLCDLSDPVLDTMASARQVLAGPAAALRRALRQRLVFPADGLTGTALRGMSPAALARLVTLVQGRARSLPASALDDAEPITILGGTALASGALSGILDLPAGREGPLAVARLGGVPALSGDGLAEGVVMVGRNGRLPLLRCTEQQGQLLHFVFFRDGASPVVYLPGDNVFVSREVLDAAESCSLLATLDASLAGIACALAATGAQELPNRTLCLGMLASGGPDAARPQQGLVQEVDALASFIAALPPGQPIPALNLAAPASSFDAVWPVEELFPEWEGLVSRAPSEVACLSQAVASGTTLLALDGLPGSRAARDRLRAALGRREAATGLSDQVRAACTGEKRPRIVVALGLGSSAAAATDLVGFYSRLATALAERFGQMVFLLDGTIPEVAGKPGEPDWLVALRTALSTVDAAVVNLVGMPFRDGLCWLAHASFFVAPLGEELGRLRWMLDVPGLVLMEEADTAADPLHAYKDEASLGGPVAPLHSGRMDATRLERDGQGPIGRKGRTRPKVPVLHEDALIERIGDLIAADVPGHDPAKQPVLAPPPPARRRIFRTLFGKSRRASATTPVTAAALGPLPALQLTPKVEAPQGPGLRCVGITKDYRVHHGRRRVLDGVNLDLARGQKLGILGSNGAGKSTLIRIIGGVDLPTSGHVVRDMSTSWPLGFSGGFQGSLSGIDNIRFICRIYGLDYDDTRLFVDDFAELGSQLGEPVKNYSSGMRARLAFALSIAIEFECYLVDEVIMVGDRRFGERCRQELFEKRADRALILVSHSMEIIRSVCDSGAVLHERRLQLCDSVADAISLYESL